MTMESLSSTLTIVLRKWDVRRPLSFVNAMAGYFGVELVHALSRAIVGHAGLVRDSRKLLVRRATKALKSRRFAPLHPFASSGPTHLMQFGAFTVTAVKRQCNRG
ncbi:hypothetical protein [Cupriavidus pauculus]|uniref:hypothetical protein n=1 Tax=Cupriavidus pauculus TaxID=82633 RepID=UPI001EE1F0CA|nr:hypothetical protein [Cupriavidus pauculus]GJG96425.1 hypothetical protein CBA19C6_18070 [Cupriavidus pauculus]